MLPGHGSQGNAHPVFFAGPRLDNRFPAGGTKDAPTGGSDGKGNKRSPAIDIAKTARTNYTTTSGRTTRDG